MEGFIFLGIFLVTGIAIVLAKGVIKFVWDNTVKVLGVVTGVAGVMVLGIGLAAVLAIAVLA